MAASDDRGPAILEAQWISFGIALLLLCARMLSRIYFVHRVALDDWAILFTMASDTGLFVSRMVDLRSV